jgi:thymidine kinase
MAHDGREGSIEVITGVMFSGKSEELLRRVRRALIARRSVQVFKSHLDDRYSGIHAISSHDGRRVEARPVSSSLEIAEHTADEVNVVAIDEVQFLDTGIIAVANRLADRGVRVIISGTDMDFRGEPFGPIGPLLAIAERIDKLHAICVVCGELATRNQRLIDGLPAVAEGPTIQVGGSETYEARCRNCHDVPSSDDDQIRLIEDFEEAEPDSGSRSQI